VFAINDDLSISYGNYESKQITATQSATAGNTVEATSYQIAYSAGGLSVRLADQDVQNGSYQTATLNQTEGTTLSVALAF
jgi:hypothetical protein